MIVDVEIRVLNNEWLVMDMSYRIGLKQNVIMVKMVGIEHRTLITV